jgi:hypothetical protein
MENFHQNSNSLESIKGNHSILGDVEDINNFHEMKTEEGDDLERFSKKQHFVSLLASSLVPIAAIGVRDGKYYSELVENHESHNDVSDKKAPLFALVQYVLFRDTDKPGFDRSNIIGGVSFDFDYARFDKKDLPTYEMRLPLTLEKLNSVNDKDINDMVASINNFRIQISNEEGLKFIEKVIEKSGYKIFSSQEIQDVLLKRTEELESILNNQMNQKDEKSLFSKLIPSDLNKGETDREFYQYDTDPSKIIRIDTFDDLIERYDNIADPTRVVDLGKKLFSEIQMEYDIKVPAEIVLDKDEKNKDAVYIITDRIKGASLEEYLMEGNPEFLKKFETLYVSISKYYLDKLNSKEAHLADLNNMSQYIYGKKKGDTEDSIYLVDTDLYLNKGDAYLLHNVKWLIRHMPKKFDEAIKNIRKIIESPLSKDLSQKDRIMAEKEIKECLSLLDGTFQVGEPENEEGFMVSPLD